MSLISAQLKPSQWIFWSVLKINGAYLSATIKHSFLGGIIYDDLLTRKGEINCCTVYHIVFQRHKTYHHIFFFYFLNEFMLKVLLKTTEMLNLTRPKSSGPATKLNAHTTPELTVLHPVTIEEMQADCRMWTSTWEYQEVPMYQEKSVWTNTTWTAFKLVEC